ncbi:MAG: GGDEF domain-containing protein [Acidobacteriota bacterium]|nr:GGDEF domain-containing protein [Acidobacteriota bacterium]
MDQSLENSEQKSVTRPIDETKTLEAMEFDLASGKQRSISYLVVLAGGNAGQVIRLERNCQLRAGRDPECDLFFDCDNVSREHAVFLMDNMGRTRITDLGSTNGTLVNGKRIESLRLEDGDRICLGNVILRFCFKDGLEFDFQQNLYDKATRDPLTGVYNKRFFTEALEREMSFHGRHGHPLSILIVDLDNFKRINDKFGHLNGDIVLKTLGGVLSGKMRAEDTFARFGGEEFVGMLRHTSKEQALKVAEKLREMIAGMSFATTHDNFSVTATIGVATFTGKNYDSPEAILMAADNNLYIGKTRGRNMVIG